MTADLFPDTINKGAVFSPCRRYRYTLWRIWDDTKRPIVFIGLNPSTADEVDNDPTVERVERRAKAMGYGGLIVVNIFAFRATDPRVMLSTDDPIGTENDRAITVACGKAGMILCGWGAHGDFLGRGETVRKMLMGNHPINALLCHLGLTKTWHPRHPLYISYKTLPMAWRIQ